MDDIVNYDQLLAVLLLFAVDEIGQERVPRHTSVLTRAMYYQEMMNTPHEALFSDLYRMPKNAFLDLVDLLVNSGGLRDPGCVRGRWS